MLGALTFEVSEGKASFGYASVGGRIIVKADWLASLGVDRSIAEYNVAKRSN